MPRTVAIFDFDNTLITKDSFLPFLTRAAGWPLVLYAFLRVAMWLFVRELERAGRSYDARSFIKAILIGTLLAGKKVEKLQKAAQKTAKWQKTDPQMRAALRRHHEKGATIVIASGSLNLYLPELLRDIPYDALICTDVGVEGGIVTGVMTQGNCVRARKAERVSEWLAANGPFDEIWAYGNFPDDLPMMQLAHHRVIAS